MTNQENSSKAAADLRQKAEAFARERAARTPEDIAAHSPEEIRKTLHELRVHQIELEMQNEELRMAQAEIEAGRDRFYDLYDLAPVGYCTLSEQGLILEANLTAATLLGAARGMLVKQPITRFILKDDQDIYYLHRKKLFETGEAQEFELRLVKPDGAVFWAHLTATAVQAEDGAPLCRVALSDITERKQAEEHFQKFKQIVSSTSDGISLVDNDYRYVIMNKAYETFSGRKKEELIGVTVAEYLGESVFDEHIKPHFDRSLNGETVRFQDWFEYPTLGKRFVEVTYYPYIDAMGDISGVVANTRDITERKRAEEAFESQNTLLSMIMETSPVGITTVDVEGSITYANYQAERILGIEKNTITARKYDSPEWSHTDINGEPLQDEKQPFYIVKTTGKPAYNIQHGITWPDGRSVILSINASPMSDKEGQFAGMVATFEDITERKQTEAEREKLHAQFTQAQKMEAVGRLAGGVAHDFNNMLGIIIGHADMLLEQMGPDQPFHADLIEIRKAGVRSADLTRQLLAFARKQTVAPKVIDLNEAVEGMLKMLYRLIGEDIDMAWIPGEKVWPVKIDPGQIDQILANLCVNARDAIAGVGKVTIETSNIVFDDAHCRIHAGFVPGEYAMMAVSDNGRGMDYETMSHLYEPFFTTKELGKGTGLGLATVYGVVKQNNGFINVYSEPGQGTTFKIYLPRHSAKAARLPEKGPDKPIERGQETILLVEDEPAILRMTTMMLERLGYPVVAAGTPGEAIRLANEHAGDIHLLMTDVVMPEMNGRDLAKNILSLYPHLKCLFMSGYTADVIAHHGVLDEGVNFIQKPFSKRDLTVKVREVLNRD